MTQFDQEMKIFEEIKNKYKPIEGFHLVLDLDEYKHKREVIRKFSIDFDSADYFKLVSIDRNEKNKEMVLISSNTKNTLHYFSHILRVTYDYEKDIILEFEDFTPRPNGVRRSLKRQMELLAYELTHPKPQKPAC